ncbi:MAG: hypothetical protein N2484_03405 [Clostridia bacterium]|nr:hypothetical protein [Clostridia bacterium]
MGEKSLYRKLFFIFDQEDSGFGTGQGPSGYVKIETREGKGKLSAVVQNLKEDTKTIVYKLYVLKCKQSEVHSVPVGVIPLQKGKGELHWEFTPDNYDRLGSTIDEMNVVAVLAEYMNREQQNIICPLVAYKDKKIQWKELLKEKLYTKKSENTPAQAVNPPKTDITSKYENKIESLYEGKKGSVQSAPIKSTTEFVSADEAIQNTQSYEEQDIDSEQEEFNEEMDSNEDVENQQVNNQEDKGIRQEPFAASNSEPKQGCMMGEKHSCAYLDAANGYNPCTNCFMQNAHQKNAESSTIGDVDRLKKELDRCFEICDPFRSRRRDYKWWKVNSPVHLNNVLYQCNVKTPVLFNPKILMSHFKYRHLIFGIYSDTVRNKEYVVFGVPGVYSVDERPFQDICRWAQVEGNKPRYGAFGYWLVYIDPKTGKIV